LWDLENVYSSPNIVGKNKSERIREVRNAYKILVAKRQEKLPFVELRQ
jgi:hypothetical protein